MHAGPGAANRRAGVELWLRPARLVPAGVDGLPVVKIVRGGGRRAGPPGGVRPDGLDITVLEHDVQLPEEAQLVPVEVGHAVPGQSPAVPAVAQGHSNDGGRLDQLRYVVAAVAEPPFVGAPAGAQDVLTHGNPVDEGLVDAERGGTERRLGHGSMSFCQPEFLAQERGAVELFIGGDHGCLPGCQGHVVVFRSA